MKDMYANKCDTSQMYEVRKSCVEKYYATSQACDQSHTLVTQRKKRFLLSSYDSCRALPELGRVQVIFRHRIPILSWQAGESWLSLAGLRPVLRTEIPPQAGLD
jgi:hypothetical protein